MFGLSKNPRPREHVQALEASTADRYARARNCAASNSSPTRPDHGPKERRVIARVEAAPMGRDTRYIVTNLMGRCGKHLYEKLYSARG